MAESKKVAVIGFGNIGSGVVEALYKKEFAGLELVKVVDIDLERPRPVTLPPEYLSSDWQTAVNDPSIDIIVELIGGVEPAASIHLQALKNSKDVVTANKMLLAQKGQEIFSLASEVKRQVGFRAGFVGCHALIHEFQQAGVSAKQFHRIYAILNGTSNYILSTMTQQGTDFADALKEAQAGGLAESDPTDDVEGIDTANKIRLLLALIANSYRSVAPFPVEGIKEITPQDIQYADELGYSIKSVGVIEQSNGVFNVAVHPALVPRASLLGSLQGAYNGTEIEDEYGVVSGLVAPGAGVRPTTDAVLKDLFDIVKGEKLPMPSSADELVLGNTDEARRRYYLRFSAVNQAGVLAQICNIFWKYNISIAGVIQKEAVSREYVPLVMTTHLTREGDIKAAIEQVDKLEVIRAETRIIRILNADT